MTQQIIWYFDKPTVLVCPFCERVADYSEKGTCVVCGGELVEFTCDPVELQDAIDNHPSRRDPDELE